jgi:hypothetical protein
VNRRGFILTAIASAATALLASRVRRPVGLRAEDVRELYWHFDRSTRTWSLGPSTAPESGRIVDVNGCGTLRLVPLALIPAFARASRMQWRDGRITLAER